MYFYYGNSKEEIIIDFKACEKSINILIEDGYLDEEFKRKLNNNYNFAGINELVNQSISFVDVLSDAVIDCLIDIGESINDEELSDIDKICLAIDSNYYFSQFVSWRLN